MNDNVERERSAQLLLRKAKSTPFLRTCKEFTYDNSIETISSDTSSDDKSLSFFYSPSRNMMYENTGILKNEIFHPKLDIFRDIYELDQNCVLYDCFDKASLNPVEIQQNIQQICINEVYDEYKIKKILHEILETEKSYVRGLEEIVKIYIRKPVPSILYQDSRIVFANILSIFIFHKQFMLPGMIAAINKPNPEERLAEEFIKNKDFLKIYLCYVYGFEDKLHIVSQWENSEKGRKYLKSRRLLQSHKQLNLIGYLLLPIQRIPRYKLLLLQLSKYHNSLTIQSAFKQISFLAYNMNERKRQEEGSRRLFQLQQSLCYPKIDILMPWRRLIKESRMHYLLTTYSSFFYDHLPVVLDREVSVVLCNDILIIFNSTHTSIVKTMNVKELQITRAWERPNTGLRFICWDSKEIWHFDTIDNNVDEWIAIVNRIHIDS